MSVTIDRDAIVADIEKRLGELYALEQAAPKRPL